MKTLIPLVFVLAAAPTAAQTTTLLTLDPAGGQTNGPSLYPEMSADMRFVAWQSGASNLVLDDTNDVEDVFVRELATGTTVRASLGAAGNEGDADSLEPEISADGRHVVFFSFATNLVAGDVNGFPDIYVRDLVLGATVRASVGPGGAFPNSGCRYPTISGDGRHVAFESTASNLVAGDTNGVKDIFVRDLLLGTTVRVSVDSGGVEGNDHSSDANVSPDGRYVAYESTASNLVAGDTNGAQDVFVHDLVTGTTVRASVDAAGAEADGPSADPYLSDQAQFVAFDSAATDLVAGDTNFKEDVFVKDLVSGAVVRASVSAGGTQSDWGSYDPVLTPDGRSLVFFSKSTNLVAGDTNGVEDIFFCDLVLGTIERASVAYFGQQGNGVHLYPAVSSDGRYVVFDGLSTNLVPGDVNGHRDIFLRDRAGSFHYFCSGDGSLATPCPCGNSGSAGRGCANSATAGGALLVVAGVTQPDTVRLDASGELASALSIFLQGDAANGAGLVFGDGLRCASGNLKRLYVKNATSGSVSAPVGSDPTITQRSAALGDTIQPGATRWYQVYYRDPDAAFCPGGTFNVTNGVRVGW